MNKEWQPEEKFKDAEETWFCEHADVLDSHDDQLKIGKYVFSDWPRNPDK